MSLSISWSSENGARIASVGGRIDSANANEFESRMQQGIQADDQALIIDVSGVNFMSSSGLRVVLQLAKAFRSPRSFSVCGLSDFLAEIFAISGFDQIVTIHPAREDAVAAL